MTSSTTTRTSVLRGTAAAAATHAIDTDVIGHFTQASVAIAQNPAAALEAAHQGAMERGYADGLEAARSDVAAATEDANRRVRRALAALCEAVDSFDSRQTIALADVEDAIVAGALEVARAVLGRELAVTADPGAEAIARAMQLAPGRGDVLARLHPDDAATLSMDSVSTTTRTVRVIADPSVEHGGCIAEIGNTVVDAQLSSALAKVRDALVVPEPLAAQLPPAEPIDPAEFALKSPAPAADEHTIASEVAGSDPTNSRTTASEMPLS